VRVCVVGVRGGCGGCGGGVGGVESAIRRQPLLLLHVMEVEVQSSQRHRQN